MGESSELSTRRGLTQPQMSRIQGQIVWEGQTEEGREGAEVGYNVPFFLRIIAEYVAGILDEAPPLGSRFILWTKVILYT